MKIAILATYALIPCLQKLLPELERETGLSLSLYDYGKLSGLCSLYPKLHDQYDGFVLSGFAGLTALKRFFPEEQKPDAVFDTSLEEIYLVLLRMLDQNRSLDLSRVAVDIYLQVYETHSCKTLIAISDMEAAKQAMMHFWETISLPELDTLEDRLTERILKRWKEGKLDHVIARNASIIPRLKEAGIPYTFLYPSSEQVLRALRSLAQYISSEQSSAYMAAAIAVVRETQLSSYGEDAASDEDQLQLQQALLHFKKERTLDFQFQSLPHGFLLFTNLRTVDRITNHLKCCELSAWLSQKLPFRTRVAYGIAPELSDARRNALEALREAHTQKAPFALFLDQLIGPLASDAAPVARAACDASVQEAAERSSLSPATLQKIRLVLQDRGSQTITASELSEKLGVKIRNTNRILQALLKAGLAEAAGLRATGTKGRPTRVYRISL